jgi:hypothetical protein
MVIKNKLQKIIRCAYCSKFHKNGERTRGTSERVPLYVDAGTWYAQCQETSLKNQFYGEVFGTGLLVNYSTVRVSMDGAHGQGKIP